ncbi:hypothetical protein [Novosphingobium huizhouense]|uniref:hypothetical protein n=1 Tax=Novosphingobium huizhouense TaxID=2866625 RepID=UPI001CD843BE|nr:hypothetical protein [Novosphingobium huizhouense]
MAATGTATGTIGRRTRSAGLLAAGLAAAAAATATAAAAKAAPVGAPDAASARVRLASDVFVERFAPAGEGRVARVLERAAVLRPGDRVVFVVNWQASRAQQFTLTNPMPQAIAFEGSAREDAQVSVDGGRTWGALDQLSVRTRDGRLRPATGEDVTHVRWRVPGAMAALGAGQMTYRGIVR